MHKLKNHIDDLLLAVGTCAITYGVFLLSLPAAFIVGGLLLIAWAFLWARAAQPIVEIDPPDRMTK
jgi:uncharacterized membrane protein